MRDLNNHKYDDIINLPHHVSKKHPQMSLEARSAQFAPFAALTGYGDALEETQRETEDRIELDEEQKKILDRKIQILREKINQRPSVVVTYFIPDLRKEGGTYITVSGNVLRIDGYKQSIILEDKTDIPINEIIEILGNIFSELDY